MGDAMGALAGVSVRGSLLILRIIVLLPHLLQLNLDQRIEFLLTIIARFQPTSARRI